MHIVKISSPACVSNLHAGGFTVTTDVNGTVMPSDTVEIAVLPSSPFARCYLR